jgi:hypothetical protein
MALTVITATGVANNQNYTFGSVTVGTISSNVANTAPVIRDSTGTEIGQFCRAWVNLNGSTGAIRASFNVSSVTRTSAGQYTVNMTTALADANYSGCVQGWSSQSLGGYSGITPVSSSQFYISTYQPSAFTDQTYVFASIFR